jgi:hypothetical protein
LASYQSDPQEAKANRRKRRRTARANTPNAAFSVPIVVVATTAADRVTYRRSSSPSSWTIPNARSARRT